MDKLGLEKGKDISQLLYLNPEVLERSTSYGGIDIKNEAEVILVDPKKIVVREVETQTELNDEELKEKNNQINQLSQKIEELETERDNLKEKYNQLRLNISNILYPKIEEAVLAESDRELVNQVEMIIKRLNDLKVELDIEKGWWDKWINDENFYFLW